MDYSNILILFLAGMKFSLINGSIKKIIDKGNKENNIMKMFKCNLNVMDFSKKKIVK